MSTLVALPDGTYGYWDIAVRIPGHVRAVLMSPHGGKLATQECWDYRGPRGGVPLQITPVGVAAGVTDAIRAPFTPGWSDRCQPGPTLAWSPRVDATECLPPEAIALLARYGLAIATLGDLQDMPTRPRGTHGRVVIYWSDQSRECRVCLDGVLAIRTGDTWCSQLSRADMHCACILRGREKRASRATRRMRHRLTNERRDAVVDALARGDELKYISGQEGGRVLYRDEWYSARGIARTLLRRAGLELECGAGRARVPDPVRTTHRPRKLDAISSELLDHGCAA